MGPLLGNKMGHPPSNLNTYAFVLAKAVEYNLHNIGSGFGKQTGGHPGFRWAPGIFVLAKEAFGFNRDFSFLRRGWGSVLSRTLSL
jgi:hypothetical protein